MNRAVSFLGLVLIVGIVSTALAQQPKGTLRGTWKVVEVNGGAEGTNTRPQPGLFMFTDKYYSAMRVTGTKARPKFASNNMATDAEKVASYDGFFAQAGTYEVSGTTITTRPLVAKAEFPMTGPPSKAEIKIDGDTLKWTFATGQVLTFTRVD
jgi:hypothetical protein